LYIFQTDESDGKKKYVSKGKGVVSFEKHLTKNSAVVLFRNPMGVKLIEGIFTKNTREAEKVSKNFRNISTFSVVEIKDSKPSLRMCKLPVSGNFFI